MLQHVVADEPSERAPIDVDQPINPTTVKRLILDIIERDDYAFTNHAEQKLAAEKMEHTDCVAVLRAGTVEPGEFERGSYTYRVRTQRMAVVITFRSETRFVVVTAWRIKQ